MHRVQVTSDIAPLMSKREGDRNQLLGILTAVLDGQGYKASSGTHGTGGYDGDTRFTLLAATTPIGDSAWDTLSILGNRLIQFDFGEPELSDDALLSALLSEMPYQERVSLCGKAVGEAINGAWGQFGGYGSVEWVVGEEEREFTQLLIRVSRLVRRTRSNYGDGVMREEESLRLVTRLQGLCRGRAILHGRKHLIRDDVALAVRVALDSMPHHRRKLIRALLQSENGILTSVDGDPLLGRKGTEAARDTTIKRFDELLNLGEVVAVKHGSRPRHKAHRGR